MSKILEIEDCNDCSFFTYLSKCNHRDNPVDTSEPIEILMQTCPLPDYEPTIKESFTKEKEL